MFNDHKPEHQRKHNKIVFVFIIPVIFLAMGLAVQWLWNAILPDVIHVGVLSFWQALGLLALSRILVGGFGFGGRHGKQHFSGSSELKGKWIGMNEEEKKIFRDEWRNRCGRTPQ